MEEIAQTERPELIFALVGAAGVRLDDLTTALKAQLATFGYSAVDIRLSDLLGDFDGWTDQTGASEFDRITHLQKMGNALRKRLNDGAGLARAGIAEIRKRRAEVSGSPDIPVPARAYILRQLKHPAEVDLLRQVYGASFFLIAGHAPRRRRVEDLAELMARKASQPGQGWNFQANAVEVIKIDEKQDDEFGQDTRDTYPRADFFANLALTSGENAVGRFVELLFGHPFRTPSPEEYAMYQASAVSLRSSDNNRQVGAAIIDVSRDLSGTIKNADVVAFGMNEVPRGGGGFYWDQDSPDCRDQALLQRGEDRATEIKISALAELIEKIKGSGWLKADVEGDSPTLAQLLLPNLKRTQFMNLGEFGRTVHAEMAALIDAARRGVPVNGLTMYVTTFPCHNCAKHIVAAGIKRVVYLEPYPKSRANLLHGEEIELESIDGREQDGKVVFCAFSGIAPRQYRQLFSMSERGLISLAEWYDHRSSLSPLHIPQSASLTYLSAERRELDELSPDIYHWNKQDICPDMSEHQTGTGEPQGHKY
ncbi:MAG TPA: anti-phage dCTP deaminase [Pyrinomonadaceae bacterium]|nr:anti-phage dCTP deaminase [Pyrinomonadaceae bacterium]